MHGTIASITGLQHDVVHVWVHADDGATVPVAVGKRSFWDLVVARGAENLIGSTVLVELDTEDVGHGPSLRFDDASARQ